VRKRARTSSLALTAELVARVARTEPDPGPQGGSVFLTDEDYEGVVDHLLAQRRPDPVWLFAYGSLIWKPEIEHEEERAATAPGWHRSFCLRLTRWRGTPDRPGLMMALDRGGCCNGVMFRLAESTLRDQLGKLLRREMNVKYPGSKRASSRSPLPDVAVGTSNVPRWISVRSNGESFPALAFVANPHGRVYTGRLEPDEVARILATAAGHWGSCAEYLYNTILHLDARGIRDEGLWRLQALVAKEIEAAHGARS